MKRRKKTPRQKAIREADKWFSKYIRLRDCKRTTGFSDSGACVSCGRVYPFEKLQCGHFVKRSCWALRYDERNSYAQCYGCNIAQNGNYREYTLRLIDRFGLEFVQTLQEESSKTRRYKTKELEELADEYKRKYEREA